MGLCLLTRYHTQKGAMVCNAYIFRSKSGTDIASHSSARLAMDSVLPPVFFLQPTKRFSAVSSLDAWKVDAFSRKNTEKSTFAGDNAEPPFPLPERRLSDPYRLYIHWDCQYTERIVRQTALRRAWCAEVLSAEEANCVQIGDFEHLSWEPVLSGESCASSYLVRKGLARKAQLSLQIRRYLAKHPQSILRRAVPETLVVETWAAFEDKLDLGGGMLASFDVPGLQQAPLRQRLDWSLTDAKALFVPDVDTATGEVLHLTEHTKRRQNSNGEEQESLWILKPSVTNKGADIAIVREWDDLLDALESAPDMREWVLQHYLPNPLLVGGHKFHLRVYVLCVGALRVFVFDDILMLIAAHQ